MTYCEAYYTLNDMEEFIPEEINSELWPYHFSAQEMEKDVTDEQSSKFGDCLTDLQS